MGANGLQYSVIDAVKKRTAPTLEGNNMRLPVKFRRSSLLTKVVVLLVVVSATVILVSQRSQIRSNQAQCQELAGQAGIDGLDSDDSVKKIARDKLGLVGNGEIIFSDVGE